MEVGLAAGILTLNSDAAVEPTSRRERGASRSAELTTKPGSAKTPKVEFQSCFRFAYPVDLSFRSLIKAPLIDLYLEAEAH